VLKVKGKNRTFLAILESAFSFKVSIGGKMRTVLEFLNNLWGLRTEGVGSWFLGIGSWAP
jgi:hypothetical protein